MIKKVSDNSAAENEIADLEKLQELLPSDSLNYGRLGILYEETGKYEQAVDFYTQALSQKDQWGFSSFFWYTEYRGSLSPNQMIQKLDAAIGLCPGNEALYVIRGKKYVQTYEFDKAISDFSRAIELQPNLIIAYFFRMNVYSRIDSDTANLWKVDFLKAAKLGDTIMFLHWELGLYYKSTGKIKLALKCFNKALTINPEYIWIYLERSEVHEHLREYQSAIDDLDCYLDLQPLKGWVNVEIFSKKGDVYYKMGEHSKALADYSTAIKLEKLGVGYVKQSVAELLEKRGKCYEALHEEVKAKADFSKAIKLRREVFVFNATK